MICPFRIDVDYEYCEIDGTLVISRQRQVYPECEEGDCPYYDWGGACERTSEE